MKNVTRLYALLIILAIGLSGCSKEKRIERHLYSKSGKWNNTLYEYKYYNNGIQEDATVYVNAGYIEFKKGGEYRWFFSADGITESSIGTWTNTKSVLTITGPNGNVQNWQIVEESKKKMRLELTDIDGTDREVYTLTFEKEK